MVAVLVAVAGLGLLAAGFMYAVKNFWFGSILFGTFCCIFIAFLLYMLYSIVIDEIETDELHKKYKFGRHMTEDEKKWRKTILENK